MCLHKCGSRDPLNRHGHTFLPIANDPEFILNQYQEVGQNSTYNYAEKALSEMHVGRKKKSFLEDLTFQEYCLLSPFRTLYETICFQIKSLCLSLFFSISLSVCLSVSLSLCLSLFSLYLCLSVSLSVCLCLCLSLSTFFYTKLEF